MHQKRCQESFSGLVRAGRDHEEAEEQKKPETIMVRLSDHKLAGFILADEAGFDERAVLHDDVDTDEDYYYLLKDLYP